MELHVRIQILRHIQDRYVRHEHGLTRVRLRYMARPSLRKMEHHHVYPISKRTEARVRGEVSRTNLLKVLF